MDDTRPDRREARIENYRALAAQARFLAAHSAVPEAQKEYLGLETLWLKLAETLAHQVRG